MSAEGDSEPVMKRLVLKLKLLPFEARKDVGHIFTYLVRKQTAVSGCCGLDLATKASPTSAQFLPRQDFEPFLLSHSEVLEQLVAGGCTTSFTPVAVLVPLILPLRSSSASPSHLAPLLRRHSPGCGDTQLCLNCGLMLREANRREIISEELLGHPVSKGDRPGVLAVEVGRRG